jgi:GT2 family glycosyltransferase
MNNGAVLARPDEVADADVLAGAGRPMRAPAMQPPMLVGQVDVQGLIGDITADARFTAACLLVTAGGVAVGQAVVRLDRGYASADAVHAAVRGQLGRELDRAPAPLRSVTTPLTVVVPTRGRPESVARCLRSLLRSAYPRLTVLVVDNDPTDNRTALVVHSIGDARVSYVREPLRGTSAGRNRGLVEAMARGARFVAFIDDDVEVDPAWAGRVAAALAQPGVACVCGPVLAAELDTPAQIAADEALGWRKGFARRRFSLARPPADSAIFPFSPGLFGVGANMAVDTAAASHVGGFDIALGPGTRTHGGEDCDFMIRLVLAGHMLTYEPSAYAWHHHRPTTAELADQMRGYDRGLGGFLTKIMLDPAGRAAALRRLPAALRQLRRVTSTPTPTSASTDEDAPGSSGLQKVLGLSAGAAGYLAARRRAVRAGHRLPMIAPPLR